MATLPQFQSDDMTMNLMQQKWASQINPLLSSPSNNVSILKEIPLVTGSNTINHLLGKKLSGWRIVRLRAAATLHDDQDNNPRPALTLILVSSANVVADIEVF